MKVLLRQNIDNLGWLGDVVEVAEGYARNFLFPHGLAVVPTEANLKSLAKAKAAQAEVRISEREHLERAAAATEGAEAVIAAKANEQGHLFGSVGPAAIARNLREQGLEVADEFVQLEENIRQAGVFSDITVRFAPDLTAAIKVVVVPAEEKLSTQEPGEQNQEKKLNGSGD